MKLKLYILLLVVSSIASAVAAQGTTERFLIPIAMPPTPGAFDSLWVTDFRVLNMNSFEVDARLPIFCPIAAPCGVPPLQPGEMRAIPFNETADNPGWIGYLPVGSDNVSFNLRIYDKTRQAETFGTQLPVVRERDFFSRPFYVMNVPTNSRFRVMLRIYDIDGRSDARVRIRAFSTSNDFNYGSTDVTLQPPAPNSPWKSSYTHIQYLPSLIPSIPSTASSYNLEITPSSATLKIWGFITVTHNDTQHVTTIIPN